MSSTDGLRRRRLHPKRYLAAAFLVSVSVGCQSELGPLIPRDWGLITLDHQTVSGADYMRPQALFYRSPSAPTLSGRGGSDVCGQFPYPSPASAESLETLSAGNSVTLTVQGTAFSLVPTTSGGREIYSMAEPGIAYTPGDSVALEVPGDAAGFPAMMIRGSTAEPFTLEPIDAAGGGSDTVRWTPAGDDSSRMVMSLQYHDDSSPASGLNAQVFCTFRDDGSGAISPTLIRGWATSSGERRVQAVRWRSAVAMHSDAVLYLVSTYTVTKTSFP